MAGRIEWRRATSADCDVIRRIVQDAYAKWVPLIGREPKPMTADYGRAIERHRFDLILRDGVVAGLIETVDEGEQLLIENVAVAPSFQHRGLGRALLAYAEQLARDLGRSRIRLYTNQRFAENVRLYQALGYGIDREEDLGIAVAVHMSKALIGLAALTASGDGG
jgi:GNAT superfamily N-acetyltransferase